MSEKELSFDWASCELSGYRKGFINIKIDFTSNILSWKDSNHWYNNFVRGLPKSQMQPLYNAIESFVIEYRDKSVTEIDEPVPFVWLVQIGEKDQVIELQGHDLDSDLWKNLVTEIEKVAQREFEL
ncbi:MAG: hypothetical protein GX326_04425 [Clostridiaceae bacterium]|nr:hypothetical protein [Clostridiaceae bacterium]